MEPTKHLLDEEREHDSFELLILQRYHDDAEEWYTDHKTLATSVKDPQEMYREMTAQASEYYQELLDQNGSPYTKWRILQVNLQVGKSRVLAELTIPSNGDDWWNEPVEPQ